MSNPGSVNVGQKVNNFHGYGRKLVPLDTLTATTTEQHQSFDVDAIIFVANDDNTNNLILNFDESSAADTNKPGLETAYLLYNEAYDLYIAHCAMGEGTHTTADIVNNNPTAITAKTVSALCTAVHSLKDKYNAHDNETGAYHLAAGSAHQTAAADPTTLAGAITCINEIRADLISHMADDACHDTVDTTNVFTIANAVAGDMIVKNTEKRELLIPVQCSTLYFKSSAATVAFRIWGVKSFPV